MKKLVRWILIASGWNMVVLGLFTSLYCVVQYLRDVPVEPTWFWGAWVYFGVLSLGLKQVSDCYPDVEP